MAVGGSLSYSAAVGALALAVPKVWHFLHANLSNRFTACLLLMGLMARCHGVGRKGGSGGFTAFQLGYAVGLSCLLVLLVIKWPEISIQRALSQGDVADILQEMDTHAWHEGLTLHACSALARFMITSTDTDKVASAGATTRLLNAMQHHRKSAQVQAKACSVLGLLAHEGVFPPLSAFFQQNHADHDG